MDEQRSGYAKCVQHRVDQFLFRYRNIPTKTTDETLAQLLLSWRPRRRLSLLHPISSNEQKRDSSEPRNTRTSTEGPGKSSLKLTKLW